MRLMRPTTSRLLFSPATARATKLTVGPHVPVPGRERDEIVVHEDEPVQWAGRRPCARAGRRRSGRRRWPGQQSTDTGRSPLDIAKSSLATGFTESEELEVELGLASTGPHSPPGPRSGDGVSGPVPRSRLVLLPVRPPYFSQTYFPECQCPGSRCPPSASLR